MSIEYPSDINEVASRARTDAKSALPDSNPFQVRNSFLNAIIVALAGRSFDIYNQIRALQDEAFPDTAEGEFLERWGTYKDIGRNPASQSSGLCVVTGVSGTTIPVGTLLIAGDTEVQYATSQEETINEITIISDIITRSGQTATFTSIGEHHYASGMSVVIAGANDPAYNGTFSIVVTGLTTFTYTVVGSPPTPDPSLSSNSTTTMASVEVASVTFGSETNLINGSVISFVTPVPGADNQALVQFEGLTGGEDLESDDDLRERILERYRNPISNFNAAQIETQAKEVSGVTRVFIEEITPSVGQVTIYFTRDNDDSIIPDGDEVAAVKDKILEIKPAHVDPDDVIVLAPSAVVVNFVFNSIAPDTPTMRDAVTASLAESFRDNSVVGENFLQVAYDSAVWETVDPETGDKITNFSINQPPGDVSVNTNELAILGTVTF